MILTFFWLKLLCIWKTHIKATVFISFKPLLCSYLIGLILSLLIQRKRDTSP